MNGNSLAIGGYGYDPYFMAAFNSYNPNFYGVQNTQAQAANQAAIMQQQAKGATTGSETAGANTSFKGASEEIKGEKKSRSGWVLAGLVSAAGIYAAVKGHKIGVGDTWLAKTADGLKQYWNKGVNAVGKWKLKTNVPPVAPATTGATTTAPARLMLPPHTP